VVNLNFTVVFSFKVNVRDTLQMIKCSFTDNTELSVNSAEIQQLVHWTYSSILYGFHFLRHL